MKIDITKKAQDLKLALAVVVDAMVLTIEADNALREVAERVPLSAELLQGIERYLRTESATCEGCGLVKDADKLDLGRCAACESQDIRQ